MRITQDWHNRMVAMLFNSAKGDLILSSGGDLCDRNIWSDAAELSWEQHTVGSVLATIGGTGWTLTPNGADYVLENCPPGSTQDRNKLGFIGYPQR